MNKLNPDTFKGIIYDIKRFAIHDGPGIRTTVFFKGCPLQCWWCHNPESRNPGIVRQPEISLRKYPELFPANYPFMGREVTIHEIIEIVLKDQLYYDESDGGVTISGGEPFYQPEFLCSLLSQLKSHGVDTAVDTTGYTAWKNIECTLKNTDLYLYDLKLINNKEHEKYTGVSNQLILSNLEKLKHSNKNVIVRIPLIPEITATESNLSSIAKYLKENNFVFPVQFLPYNIIGESKYEKLGMPLKSGKHQRQSTEEIESYHRIFEDSGIEVIREQEDE